MAKLKVHGFDSYKKIIKEGIYKPGFITEYEDESIDELTDDKTAPASDGGADAAPVAATPDASATDAPAEDAPAEQTTAEDAPEATPAAEEANVDFGTSSDSNGGMDEYQVKIQFVSGVFDEYKTYLKNNGQLKDAMQKKIDAAFDLLNGED